MNTAHANPPPGRDEKGRFTAGNKGGPGNPFARKVAALRQALLDSVSPKDIQEVAARLLAEAKEGDVQAAKLLLAYAIGKPQPAPEPDRLDADEWHVYQEVKGMKQETAALISAGPPDFHLNCVRAARPVVADLWRMQVDALARETPEQRDKREADEAAECERILSTPAPLPEDEADEEAPSPNGKKRRSSRRRARFQPSPNGDSRLP